MMEEKSFLPPGSIAVLKGAIKKLMIASWACDQLTMAAHNLGAFRQFGVNIVNTDAEGAKQ